MSLCIAIGALTHIGWDTLTHELGSYALLQMASTLGGLGLVGLTTWRWFERTPARTLPAPNRDLEYRRFVARILVGATFVCTSPVAAIWIALTHAGSDTHPVVLGGHALLTGLGCAAVLLTGGGVWLNRGGLKT